MNKAIKDYPDWKRTWTNRTAKTVKQQYMGQPINTSCAFVFVWFLPNMRKDCDNVAFNKKAVLDGMVRGKMIKDDTHRILKGGLMDLFYVDKKYPRVEVCVFPNMNLGDVFKIGLKHFEN